ncbi:MAG: hypothetical protein ACTSQ0_02190 [Candidatus Heimdallarchaeota archaeon]
MKKRINVIFTLGVLALIFLSSTYFSQSARGGFDAALSTKDAMEESVYNPLPPVFSTNSLSEGLTKIGQLDVDFGNAYRVKKLSSDLLVVSGLSGGVTFVDVSNKSDPFVLGNFYDGGETHNAIENNDLIYTANVGTGIEVLDYSDFNNIEKIGGYYDGGEAKDIAFIGFYTIYVADGSDGLEVFSIKSGATNFTKVTADTFGIAGLDVLAIRADPLNNICFLMCGDDGVLVIDTTRPTTPVLIDILKDGSMDSRTADSSAFRLYVADGANGLKVYNYSDRTDITLMDHMTIDSGIAEFINWDVAKKAYMTTGAGGHIYQLNITNLSDIQTLWKLQYTPGQANGVLSVTSALYICNDFDFKIIDISNKTDPFLASEITFAGEPSATAVSGNTVVLAEGITGIDIINITDPLNPVLLSKYEDEVSQFKDVDIIGDNVYCATSEGLKIIDISDLENPTLLRSVAVGAADNIVTSGNYAYLSVTGKDLCIVDISTPATAFEETTLDTAEKPYDIAIEGTYAYVAVGASGFQVIDITDPTSPSIDATQATTSAEGIAVSGDLVAIADGTAGLKLYNISNLVAIVLADTELTSGYDATKLEIDGNDLFVAVKDDGIVLINITITNSITKLAHFDDGGIALEVTLANTLLFVADALDSLEIIGKDTDLDNVADYSELNIWGTDPNVNDTDLDGILDGDEIEYWEDRDIDPLSDFDGDTFANLLDIDSDDDTIIDGDEVYFYGSDPINLDSDDDFIPDEEEVILGVDGFVTHPANADTDGDAVIDGNETLGYYSPTNPGANASGFIVGLDPTNNDTDGDIPWDGWEIFYGFNPLAADSGTDSDTDGLTEAEEFLAGTDPFDDDTDDDGLTDGDEVNIHFTDPNKEDTDDDFIPDKWEIDEGLDPLDGTDGAEDEDSDGLTNYEEYFWGTDPFDSDSDNDSLPDEWEVHYGLNPNANDSELDLDHDGLSNEEEYALGTMPNDPDSDDDGFNDFYEVEHGTDPLDPDDFPITVPTTGPVGIGTFVMLTILGLAGASMVIYNRFTRRRR